MRSEIRLLGQGDSICGLWESGASIVSLSCTLHTCYHLFSLILTQRSLISAHLQPSSQNLNELTPSSRTIFTIFSLTITSTSYLFIYLLLLFVGTLTSQKPSHLLTSISIYLFNPSCQQFRFPVISVLYLPHPQTPGHYQWDEGLLIYVSDLHLDS